MSPINDNAQLIQLLSLFAAQLPILIVCLFGCVVIMGRKTELSTAASWALMGFGLSVVLCVVIPLVQVFAQNWVVTGGGSMARRASVFTVLGVVWSLLRAVSYALLLMAIVAGRSGARMENRG